MRTPVGTNRSPGRRVDYSWTISAAGRIIGWHTSAKGDRFMSPFIKFTEEKQSPAGASPARFIYLNVAHVAKAAYSLESEELMIWVDVQGATDSERIYTLRSEEAQAALKILRELP
jgi:hypothetical protein